MTKKECPFCHKKFVGTNEATGKTFFEEHVETCEFREPPSHLSLPIQEKITKCQKCGCTEFRYRSHYDMWSPRRKLWEYACKECGQHHTALASMMTVASEAPYNIKTPKKIGT